MYCSTCSYGLEQKFSSSFNLCHKVFSQTPSLYLNGKVQLLGWNPQDMAGLIFCCTLPEDKNITAEELIDIWT